MGMSTSVVGIVPPDEAFKKMKAIYDTCTAAGVAIPDAVEDFFGGEPPEPKGAVVDLDKTGAVTQWSDDVRDGYDIDLNAVPTHVKIIRVYNSW